MQFAVRFIPVTWLNDYRFPEAEEADQLRVEVLRELSAGDVLHGAELRVVARALPRDEVIVETSDGRVALVQMTWMGRPETPPWPTPDLLTSAAHLEQTIEFRY